VPPRVLRAFSEPRRLSTAYTSFSIEALKVCSR
jgi:hypothetical protein